jgi:hypothetical protein
MYSSAYDGASGCGRCSLNVRMSPALDPLRLRGALHHSRPLIGSSLHHEQRNLTTADTIKLAVID